MGKFGFWLLAGIRGAMQRLGRATEWLERLIDYLVFLLQTLFRFPSTVLAKIRGTDEASVFWLVETFAGAVWALISFPHRWFRNRLNSSEATDAESVSEFVESRIARLLFHVAFPYHWLRNHLSFREAASGESASEYVESRVGKAIFFISFPYHWLRNRLHAREAAGKESVSDYLESKAGLIFFFVTFPYHWLQNRLNLIEAERKRTDENSFVSVLLWYLFAPPFYTLHAVGQVYDFSREWLFTRNPRMLLGGIPAILLVVPVAMCLILTAGPFRHSQIQRYRVTLADAIEEEDDELARICFDKLEQLNFEKVERAEFRKVMLLSSKERYEEAYEIAKELAPEDEPGYLDAHLWIAGALRYEHIEDPDPWKGIETHLRHANSINAEHPIAKRLQVELHLHNDEPNSAKDLMESIVHIYPELHSVLMQIHFQNDDLLEATNHAKATIRFFEEMKATEKPLELVVSDYERWAHSFSLAGDAKGEFQILTEALQKFPEQENLRARLRRLLDKRIKNEVINDETLKELLAADPSHQETWKPLVARELAGDETARQLIEDLQEEGVMPADFYLLLGDMHFSRQEYAEARHFYEITCQTDPSSHFAWNNVAWILANVGPRDIDRALDSVNRAIKLIPDPRFFETRGQIYMQLQRFEEAVVDLAKAANGDFPEMDDVHRSLAIAYRHLGEADLSTAHEARITQ